MALLKKQKLITKKQLPTLTVLKEKKLEKQHIHRDLLQQMRMYRNYSKVQ